MLQEAYVNPVLRGELLNLIDVDGLRSLVINTLGFLELLSTPSSALSTDHGILKAKAHQTHLLPKAPE